MKVRKLTQEIFEEELNIKLKERRRQKRERKLAEKKKRHFKLGECELDIEVSKEWGYNPYQE